MDLSKINSLEDLLKLIDEEGTSPGQDTGSLTVPTFGDIPDYENMNPAQRRMLDTVIDGYAKDTGVPREEIEAQLRGGYELYTNWSDALNNTVRSGKASPISIVAALCPLIADILGHQLRGGPERKAIQNFISGRITATLMLAVNLPPEEN